MTREGYRGQYLESYKFIGSDSNVTLASGTEIGRSEAESRRWRQSCYRDLSKRLESKIKILTSGLEIKRLLKGGLCCWKKWLSPNNSPTDGIFIPLKLVQYLSRRSVLKPRSYQQQCRSNVAKNGSNVERHLVLSTKSKEIEHVQFVSTLSKWRNFVRHSCQNRQHCCQNAAIMSGVDGAVVVKQR